MRDRARRSLLRSVAALDDQDYDAFGFDTRPLREVVRHVSWETFASQWLPRLNDADAAGPLDDKVAFAAVLQRAGIAAPRTLGVYDRAEDDLSAAAADVAASVAASGASGIVVKPAHGRRGRKVVAIAGLRPDGAGGTNLRGRDVLVENVLERCARASVNGCALAQELVTQHPAMDGYAPQRTSTVRMFTLLRRDGSVRMLGGFLRLGRAGAMTDNIARGGVAVDIDVATGALGRGLLVEGDALRRMDQHPDSDTPFRGAVLPFWEELLALCTAGAEGFPDVRLVGWDVMITGDGPRMIEGNWDVRLRTLQALRGGIVDESLRRELGELGVAVPRGFGTLALARLPRFGGGRPWVWSARRTPA